uniref:Ubiquinone biosynthesis monooxygenase COQ6, mitochondrial n=1 Tax=Lutzomyia longipalpis TaxID=7200 RepID=A0A1B0CV72_LUTLO
MSSAQDILKDTEKHSYGKSERNHYDVVIVGGGMVGTVLASSLGNNEQLLQQSLRLNHNTIDLLSTIGAWNHISSVRYKEIKEMQVWDAMSDAFITFNNQEQELAYIVENDLIVDAALKTLENIQNVRIEYNSSIEECSLPAGNEMLTAVTLKDGRRITCNLLVGADGAKSLVRRTMNVNTFEMPYDQFGIVATLEVDTSDGNTTAWQRFLPTGPVALLPLTEHLSSLVWTTASDEAKKLLKLQPEEFVRELNEAYLRNYCDSNVATALDSLKKFILPPSTQSRKNPPKVTKVLDNSRAAFPLGFSHASSYAKNGVVLIGDAAHRTHPLAGQGVNLGFGDVKCLTDCIDSAVCNGAHPGDLGYLLRYERERLSRNVPIMVGTHGIQKLYDTNLLPVVLLRSIGLQVTHSVPFLKKIFMDRAMY